MKRILLILSLCLTVAGGAHAQYYQLINQATNMASTIIQGGQSYRGYGDVSYLAGLGDKRADFLEFSTTHGVKISNAFFWGLGLGVDVMFCNVTAPDYNRFPNGAIEKGLTKTGVAIPLYTDFRFNLDQQKSVGFFVDLKVGAAFYAGSSYIQIGNGYITNNQSFYLRPSFGMRIPVSTTNPRLAFNVSATYQLLTSNYWYVSTNNTTLNALGVTFGFEW